MDNDSEEDNQHQFVAGGASISGQTTQGGIVIRPATQKFFHSKFKHHSPQLWSKVIILNEEEEDDLSPDR